jgi:acyl-CoA hydrolase
MPLRVASHPAKTISATQAAAMVRPGMWIDYGATLCQPDVFDQALAERKDELHDVKFRSCITMRPRAVLECDPEGHHFHWFSMHFSGYDRQWHDKGRAHYLPVNLGEIPDYYQRFIDPVDIVVLKTCREDEHGFFNFSASNLWHRDIIERAKCVMVEVTDGLPYVHGVRNGVHRSEVDFVIEGDHQAAPALPQPSATPVDVAVGQLIAAEIEDGACLQIGIGGMPNAVCEQLLHSPAQDLGVHSEMLTEGMVKLYQAGKVTNAKKQVHTGKMAFSFGLGSPGYYASLHRNPDMACLPVQDTNLPHEIMRNHRVVAINNTTQMDLQGQAASESDGFRHISGTGGQLQFVRGAYASEGGKSFMCLSSTFEKNGQRKSRIALSLTPGNMVTTPRTDMMYVVTEYGIVNLKGKSVPERALALISIAHPDYREALTRQAYEHRLLARGVSFSRH